MKRSFLSPSQSPSLSPSSATKKQRASRLSDIDVDDSVPVRSFYPPAAASSGTSTLLATRSNGSSFMKPRTLAATADSVAATAVDSASVPALSNNKKIKVNDEQIDDSGSDAGTENSESWSFIDAMSPIPEKRVRRPSSKMSEAAVTGKNSEKKPARVSTTANSRKSVGRKPRTSSATVDDDVDKSDASLSSVKMSAKKRVSKPSLEPTAAIVSSINEPELQLPDTLCNYIDVPPLSFDSEIISSPLPTALNELVDNTKVVESEPNSNTDSNDKPPSTRKSHLFSYFISLMVLLSLIAAATMYSPQLNKGLDTLITNLIGDDASKKNMYKAIFDDIYSFKNKIANKLINVNIHDIISPYIKETVTVEENIMTDIQREIKIRKEVSSIAEELQKEEEAQIIIEKRIEEEEEKITHIVSEIEALNKENEIILDSIDDKSNLIESMSAFNNEVHNLADELDGMLTEAELMDEFLIEGNVTALNGTDDLILELDNIIASVEVIEETVITTDELSTISHEKEGLLEKEQDLIFQNVEIVEEVEATDNNTIVDEINDTVKEEYEESILVAEKSDEQYTEAFDKANDTAANAAASSTSVNSSLESVDVLIFDNEEVDKSNTDPKHVEEHTPSEEANVKSPKRGFGGHRKHLPETVTSLAAQLEEAKTVLQNIHSSLPSIDIWASVFPPSRDWQKASKNMSIPYTSTPFEAKVLASKCTSDVNVVSAPSAYPSSSPSTTDPQLGSCYTFAGNKGAITLLFPHAAIPRSVLITHRLSSSSSFSSTSSSSSSSSHPSPSSVMSSLSQLPIHGQQPLPSSVLEPADSCAPANLSIYGWTETPKKKGLWFKAKRTAGERVALGNFYFDILKSRNSDGTLASQSLLLSESDDSSATNRTSLKALTIEVASNHGNVQFTCVYRVQLLI